MKRVSSKTITLLVVIVLLAINSGLLFSYYNFYLSDKMANDLAAAKRQNHESLYVIAKSVEDRSLSESVELIKLYVANNGGYVTLKDSTGTVIYANKSDTSRLFSSTTIITIDNSNYELTYSKISITPGVKLIRNFILYEIILVSTLVIVVFFVSSRRIIDPIEMITKDIKDYQFGKRPFKRKMPKKMQQIQNSFVDMVDSLELEKENQNRIIASISHDIKTPLTSVIGYADRLRNRDLPDDKKRTYVDKIYAKALMMKGILEEFDDYQSCNIKETLKLEEISIKDLCNNIKNDYAEELNDKNIKLIIKSNCDNKLINVDLVKIKRVFSNIITNSVTHFNKKNGVINIIISYKNGMVRIETADNGGGVTKEKDLRRIFEPLYTTDPSRKISGLGLSICKQIISAHNGRIYAENNEIGGLSIIFFVPVI
ncbi:MAG: HAMP domain-containing sensor histidine kinase [Bacilli bacterium]|nr:HAMP domain-containing sensor histidine kinase [Bacilli bacterium]